MEVLDHRHRCIDGLRIEILVCWSNGIKEATWKDHDNLIIRFSNIAPSGQGVSKGQGVVIMAALTSHKLGLI